MAICSLIKSSFLPYITVLGLLMSVCSCFNPKLFNFSTIQSDSHWSTAVATWYGTPTGAGSDGGACGYGNTVEQPPLSSLISAGSDSLFEGGRGCGSCYQVKCKENAACSGKSVTVVITDQLPGGSASNEVHFDLSGSAFGAMANSGWPEQLRDAGIMQIQYQRVSCEYPGVSVTFHVDSGSNLFYFSVVIEYEDGDGEISGVDLKQASESAWVPMEQSWGADWKLNSGSKMEAPFSIKLTSQSGKTLVANNVIPQGWKSGATYRSIVNF